MKMYSYLLTLLFLLCLTTPDALAQAKCINADGEANHQQ
jgi:hypothetical protein